jgi:hypothetical protein
MSLKPTLPTAEYRIKHSFPFYNLYNKAEVYFSAINKEAPTWEREMINRAEVGMTVTAMTISAGSRSGRTWNCSGNLPRKSDSRAANAAAQHITRKISVNR